MHRDHTAQMTLVLRRAVGKDMTLRSVGAPLARGLNRFAAARLVFIFGIWPLPLIG